MSDWGSAERALCPDLRRLDDLDSWLTPFLEAMGRSTRR